MGILTPALNLTRSVVRQFLRDRGVRELVTYRKWASQAFDSTEGFNVDVFNETANIRTIRLSATEQVQNLPIAMTIEAGQVLFMIDSADVPAGVSLKDQIVDANSVIFKVKQIQPVFGIVHAFLCEGAT